MCPAVVVWLFMAALVAIVSVTVLVMALVCREPVSFGLAQVDEATVDLALVPQRRRGWSS
jgi:hypothetical protein